MSDTTELIKTYAPLVTPFIPSIVEIFIKPKLQKLSKFLKRNDAQSLISVEAKFTEYLERSYEKHSFIPILIFQNQQRKLEDIYIPLTVRRVIETFKIDRYPTSFLPKYKKILIRDTAGMGKSTLMKRLFLSCLEGQRGIPVFIELRKLKAEDTIVNFIHRELNPINDEFDEDFILNLIKDGNFIFFLDGYDEIAQNEREQVTLNLHDFISKTGNNLFIMTSRPETSLASFPDFMEFYIQPLMLEEAVQLLRKYDDNGELSTEIISKLEGDTLKNVEEFLGNPLLVSLLYKSYEYKHTIPLKKHIFYRQVYDALFESHDLTKEGAYVRDKHSRLDSDSFHNGLRALGFITIKYGVEYDKDEILSFIKKAKDQCSTIEFKESRLLDDLLQTVPLFTKDGNYYRWSHKSLQDYFAAQFIWKDTGEKKTEILKKLAKSAENLKYTNLLDLYYDTDTKTFRRTIIYDYLSTFINYYEAPIRTNTKEKTNPEDINFSKLLTFDSTYMLLPYRLDNFVEDSANNPESLESRINSYLSGFSLHADGILNNYAPNSFIQFINAHFLITFLLIKKQVDLFMDLPNEYYDNRGISNFLYEMYYVVFFSNSLIFNQNDLSLSRYDIKRLNHLFAKFRLSSGFKVLDIDKCRKMKTEIKTEIEREKATDLYDNL